MPLELRCANDFTPLGIFKRSEWNNRNLGGDIYMYFYLKFPPQ